MTTGSVQFTVQRNRVGVGTGLSAGEYIYVTVESTKGVRCINKSHTLFQSVIVCSGMLTGKFKRDAAPTDPSSSRVAWVEADPKNRTQAQPSYSQYKDDERYWALIESMKEIAQKHGELDLDLLGLF